MKYLRFVNNLLTAGLCIGIVSLHLFGVTTTTAGDYVIRDNGGGVVRDFIERREELARERLRVVIDGRCASACALLLTSTSCATPRAKIGFHTPYRFEGGMIIISDPDDMRRFTLRLLAMMPPKLRAFFPIDELPNPNRGDPTDAMIWVEGADAQAAIGACEGWT